MQFFEHVGWGLKTTIFHLKREGSELEWVLFPMSHVGSREYYAAIRTMLGSCDVIFVEGVRGRRAALLTLSYRWLSKIRRLDLVTQQRTLSPRSLNGVLIFPDLSELEFEEGWRHVPLREKLLLLLLVPFAVVYVYFFGTKELVTRVLVESNLRSSDDIFRPDVDHSGLHELAINTRDARLLRTVESFELSNRSQSKAVGILYGAGHMRNLVWVLVFKLKYRIVSSDTITLFEY